MFKKFQYRLQPPEQEQAFLASRLQADKRKMERVCWLVFCMVFSFFVVGIAVVPPSPNATTMIFLRGVGSAVVLLCLLSLKRTEERRTFEWTSFACMAWLVVQFEIAQCVSLVHSETLLAGNVFIVFLAYLAVPISLRSKIFCVSFLSVASMLVWFYGKRGDVDLVNSIEVVSIYLASNTFGVVCALNVERVEREEFQILENDKQLKANLETAFARLEESVESRNQIYRVLAHDLRGGISALGSIGRLLAEGEGRSEAERDELIELLCESSKSNYELLDNLLQWTISESGSVDPAPEAISLDHSVSSCVGFLKAPAHDKRIDLNLQIDEPITVWADYKMLDTVVRNLTFNAIKFTRPAGSVWITAEKGKGDKEGFAIISIKDTGVGIEKELLSRIFCLKYGESLDGTGGERGTSLGLRICVEFVRKLGGEIWVESEVGSGAQFSFSVPMYRKNKAAAGSPKRRLLAGHL